MIAGILFALAFHPVNASATILSGIDEPTGNAYEDLYIAVEKKTSHLVQARIKL